MALAEHDAGRPSEAHRLYAEAIRLLSEINVKRALGLALAGWANVLLGEGRLTEATLQLRRALDLARSMSPDH